MEGSTPGIATRALRLLRTARHLRPEQIVGRLTAAGRRSLPPRRLPEPPEGVTGSLRSATGFPHHDPGNRREDLLGGRFRFLNRSAELGRPVDWTADGLSMLWRFHLHSFGWLHLLEVEEQVELCRDWIEANPRGGEGAREVAWHPYPTSLRIVSWCRCDLRDRVVSRSLYRQAAHLHRHLEFHPGGNHLLENARALVVAGCFFGPRGEAPAWLRRGLRLFRERLEEQVLSDGGHFERSPMYHALVLEGCADVLNLLPSGTPEVSREASPGVEATDGLTAGELASAREELAGHARRMAEFLFSLVGPDGRLPLLNDSTREIAPAPSVLLDYVERVTGHRPERRASFPETGYHVHSDDRIHLVIDGGPLGPDHLPAHAHADIFSYVLWVRGLPFVVDAGVYEYAEGPMREYVRSTAAHSTVCVDGVDQAECWSSFRVARRFPPVGVEFSRAEGGAVFSGVFEGYGTLIGDGIVHRRTVEVDAAGGMVRVLDTIEGRGAHRPVSRIHLHPGVEVELEPSAARGRLWRDDVEVAVEVGAEATRRSLAREEGWYCPEFGRRIRCPVLRIGGEVELPASFDYTLRF